MTALERDYNLGTERHMNVLIPNLKNCYKNCNHSPSILNVVLFLHEQINILN